MKDHSSSSASAKSTWYILGAIVLIGAFLRLWRIDDFATFLGDQGRDMIIMHKIATFRDLPALGPITSVGSMYLGPLFYYLMAPWLWVSGFSPLGPAVGVALLSIAALVGQFYAVRDILNARIALLSTTLAAISGVLVISSRFAWNPNLLAPASFFMVYALIKAIQTRNIRWYALTGALLSLCIQLHYLALLLGGFVALTMSVTAVKDKKSKRAHLMNIGTAFGAFVALLAPYLIFEAIHQFPNMRSLIQFFAKGENTGSPNRINEIIETTKYSFIYATNITIQPLVAALCLMAMSFVSYLGLRRRQSIGTIAGALVFVLVGASWYTGAKFPHYLGSTYILWYICIAYILDSLYHVRWGRLGIALFLASFVYVQVPSYTFFAHGTGPQQIDHARKIAHVIEQHITSPKYRLTALPEQYGSLTYRYYLIKNGHPPLETEDRGERGDELFVVCEQACKPIGEPLWDIAFFGAEKIVGAYKVGSTTVYKLMRK